jgi:hypothetical protein
MAVLRLMYTSRVARQVRLVDAEAIAETARARNQRAGITGLLLYSPSHFVQVLEGQQAELAETLARISRDPRHTQLRIVDQRSVQAREFDSWAMTVRFCSASAEDIERLNAEDALALLRAAIS